MRIFSLRIAELLVYIPINKSLVYVIAHILLHSFNGSAVFCEGWTQLMTVSRATSPVASVVLQVFLRLVLDIVRPLSFRLLEKVDENALLEPRKILEFAVFRS